MIALPVGFIIWLYLDASLAFLKNNALGCQPVNLFARGDQGTVLAMWCPPAADGQTVSYGDYLAFTRTATWKRK